MQKEDTRCTKKSNPGRGDAEKKLFDQRRKAIEDYYDEIDRSERKAERSTKLSELYEMESFTKMCHCRR